MSQGCTYGCLQSMSRGFLALVVIAVLIAIFNPRCSAPGAAQSRSSRISGFSRPAQPADVLHWSRV